VLDVTHAKSNPFNCLVKDACQLPADIGNCQNYVANWYFDTKVKRCRQFYYGGCGGNENRFATEAECDGRCSKKEDEVTPAPARQTRPPQRQETPEPSREQTRAPSRGSGKQKEHCLLPYATGNCGERHRRYYFDRGYGVCSLFPYSGCDGNENNFESLEECEDLCNDSVNICDLAPLYGRCSENETRWHYDAYAGGCQEFTFSGCSGNRNNFEDERSCLAACHEDERQPEPEPPRRQPATQAPETVINTKHHQSLNLID